ncbi:hypothetical protein R5W23_001559 [Gemmata sp. JC673]|uniref:DUF3352 domain-containing protein n=1 Tax=Gemmata algarum TaxID=2975278 RepID=A0ABU5F0Q6_9BACT|nr:hypothetical protein [Gemmata algarum]MDY3560327.1 hypothetical protein [Gemmata algarum]
MRFRWLAALAVALVSTGLANAQPKPLEPTIEVRLRSVNDLVDKFEYVAALAGKEDAAAQVREFLKALSADKKGIEGIDPKQPFGAYALLEKEVANSPFVVMVPVADEEQFLKALEKHLGVTVEKGDEGTKKVPVPLAGEAHLRFANGYVYVSQKVKDLDAKALVKPAAYFANDDGAVASLVVHVDRIPADLRAFAFGQFELGVNQERKKNEENESPAEKKLKGLVFDAILAGTKGTLDDGKDLSIKLFADPKSDDLNAEVTFSAKSGTTTARNFSAMGSKTSLPAGIVATANPAAKGNLKLAMTDGIKKEFSAAVDELFAEALKKAPDDQQAVLKSLIAAVSPTIKSGELDVAASLVGPNAKGHVQLITALAAKDGKEFEKFVKKFVGDYGDLIGAFVEIKLDVEKIGAFNLHRIELQQADDNFEKIFGTKVFWLATSDTALAISIEPEGELIKKGLKAQPVPVAVASVDAAVAKLAPLAQPDAKPDELKALLKDAFGGSPAGKDTVTFGIEGGEQLKVKFKLKGKAVRFGAGLDALKGK